MQEPLSGTPVFCDVTLLVNRGSEGDITSVISKDVCQSSSTTFYKPNKESGSKVRVR